MNGSTPPDEVHHFDGDRHLAVARTDEFPLDSAIHIMEERSLKEKVNESHP